jgi:hypothetical protein
MTRRTTLDVRSSPVERLIETHPDLDYKELAWLTYKEILIRGAKMFMAIYEASHARFG